MKSIVITTINTLTPAIEKFATLLSDWKIIIVADKKTPPLKSHKNIVVVNIEEQLSFISGSLLPFNHYARKNIGYLKALQIGSEVIYDTDDDNYPYDNWLFPTLGSQSCETLHGSKYINIYKSFTDEYVWPRGFPLAELSKNTTYKSEDKEVSVGIWQGLADLDPDIDAIHRLVLNKEITFNKRSPLTLKEGSYCPFNSQNTLWEKTMIPYAYLPSTVTFRFTDILRGYIAQRCLWAHNKVLGFTEATVYQERNDHNLMTDFKSEVPMYLQTEKLINSLDSLSLGDDAITNIKLVYERLVLDKIVKDEEVSILHSWLEDLNNEAKYSGQ